MFAMKTICSATNDLYTTDDVTFGELEEICIVSEESRGGLPTGGWDQAQEKEHSQ